MNIWAAEWHSRNKLDGENRYIMYDGGIPKIFRTREGCREWIKLLYGYIALRPDLRAEPHGWRMPQAIKVTVIKKG